MTIFTATTDGPALYATFTAARTAAANAYFKPDAAEHLAADPQQGDILARFGYLRKQATVCDNAAFGGRRDATYWQLAYPFPHFWERLCAGLDTARARIPHSDGTLTERLSDADAIAVWQQARTDSWTPDDRLLRADGPRQTAPVPTDADAPLHIAAALAAFGGMPWTAPDDDTTVTRHLRAQPLRHPPGDRAQPRNGELKNKLLFPCIGYAYLPADSAANDEGAHALVYLSAVGPHKKLKAVWAALMDNTRDLLVLPQANQEYIRARRPAGKGVFDTYWNEEPLPTSGLAHLAIHHRSMLHPRAGQPFLHLTGADGVPDLALFARQLDAASTYPIQPAWMAQLWDAGIEQKLITALPSYGCAAFWVNVHDEAAWGDLIARCAGAQTATVETYGADPTAAPPVAEMSADDD